MGLLGTLVTVAMMLYTFYLGYTDDERYFLLLFTPVVFIIGQGISRSNKSSNFFGREGTGPVQGMIVNYIVGLIVSGVCYGIGIGVMEVLKFKPPQ